MGHVPKHDKDVRHVVHPTVVYVAQFFICRGHEQQPRRHQKLNDPSHK
jgi:hypothetical protein